MTRHRQAALTGLLVGLTLLIAAAPLWQGVPRGHDWSHELVRWAQMKAALHDGQLPPAWAPDLYGGWGSPVFVFYAPLFTLLGNAVELMVQEVALAVRLTLVLLLAVGAVGAWRAGVAASGFSTDSGSPASGPDEAGEAATLGRCTAILYLLHPYLLADLYLRNAWAEATALCLAPWWLASLLVAGRRPRAAGFGVWATATLLILAHNLSALLFAVATVVAIPWLYWGSTPPARRARRALTLGGLSALATTAWFWWPALTLTRWVRPEELTQGKFQWQDNFVPIFETFGWTPVFGVGPLLLVLLVGTLITLARTPAGAGRRLRLALVAAAAIALFLMHPASQALWVRLPFLPLLQFPWRLLGPLGLFAALAGALFARQQASSWPPGRLEALILVIALANALPTLLSVRPLPPEIEQELDWALSPEVVRQSGQRGTVGDEYLPRSARQELSSTSPATETGTAASLARSLEPGIRVEMEHASGTLLRFSVHSLAPGRLGRIAVDRWAFPGWRTEIDGEPGRVLVGPEGRLLIPVPAGNHRVELFYDQPPERRHGVAMGVLGLCGLGLLFRRNDPTSDPVVDDEEDGDGGGDRHQAS